MKKIFLFVCAVAISFAAEAQLQTPAPSPFQKIEQKVGLTDVTVEYSRPSMKGRKIFGGLVPYDKLWRTGANACTKITFGDAVQIAGKTVEAGTYAIYTKPGVQNWEVYIYADTSNWGTPSEWDQSKVVASTKLRVAPIPMEVQTFTISFDDVKNDSANLGMIWESAYVSLPIKVFTDKMVSASIDKVMAGPSSNDYYQAAVYYLESGKDMNKAKMWIDKAIEMREQPAFWYHRQQSLIYAKSGDKKGAINAAKRSLELAKAAGNDDYVSLNNKSLKEWGAM
ncbi:DUF2911 domain-containing protein [Aureitalea sp. L0-47]|uniref:DUF2911 domain-containing protein n=1 Tax=Aureitalea sp. L0-47 TaxID=2816962 RepID=UPI002238B5A6|nr:DUF2911 domain-containing protein [Aureitalea sp. L0-47]MCW5520470.1 DUF2911 domain-containing protein [Aureitalea sp. L0-47]